MKTCRLSFGLVLALVPAFGTAFGDVGQVFPNTVSVGQQSQPLTITVTMSAGGTAVAPVALTQGVANMDFSVAAGGSCAAQTTYLPGQQCTVAAVFTPKYPGLRSGAVVVQSADGRVLGSRMISGSAQGSLATLTPGRMDTVAGSGNWVYTGDGVPATDAPIFLPMGVVADAAGNIFLSDANNSRIRRVDAVSGFISTIAGNGTPGYSGDGGSALQAEVSQPSGLALDGAGNIYFVDTGNDAVRRVDAVSGVITTVAGVPGMQGYSGDGGPATAARLYLPQGLALDAQQNLYIADTGNHVVRLVNATTGIIQTFAGTGAPSYNGDGQRASTAALNTPWSVFIGIDGSIYIADTNNQRVRKVDASGMISTVAGTGAEGFFGDGAAATQAQMFAPVALAQDPAGNLYIADSGNNRIRKVNAGTGIIATISGTDSEQFSGDAGPANLATMYGPYALYLDQSGNLLFADMFHNRIRKISVTTLPLMYPTMKVGKVSSPDAVTVENDGNASLALTPPVLNNTVLDLATTTCVPAALMAVDSSCNLGVEFAPTTVGLLVTGSLTAGSNAGNSPLLINVSGEVLSVEPTTVSLTSSKNPSLIGDPVTFTATISGSSGTWTGTVNFLDGTTQICSAAVRVSTASCTVSTLTLGQHNITAAYQGDEDDAAATSAVLVQTVRQAPGLVLTVSPNPAVVTGAVTLTLTATGSTLTPTGSVVFYDGSSVLASSALNASGVGTITTTQLLPGTHALSAQYAGDATDSAGQSNLVSEVVQQAATVTTLATSAASIVVGAPVTFTATVLSPGGPAPIGTVSFNSGTNVLGTATVSASGVATLLLPALAPATYNVVAKYGGSVDDVTSSSASLSQTVLQIGTVTTLVSDVSPINALATLHLTATVTLAAGATAAGPITGQVTFSDGGVAIGSAAIVVSGNGLSGVAGLAISTLAVGPHSIVATYVGGTNYSGSASNPLSQSVILSSSTAALSPLAPSLAGKAVVLSATVTGATGVPTGLVTFFDSGNNIGPGTLNGQGVATLPVASFTVGSHPITAVYAGDANFSGSSAAPALETVTLAVTALTAAGPTAPVNAGTSFTVAGTLTTNGVTPTGALTLRDGGNVIAAQTASAGFNFPGLLLAVGTHSLTVTYAGDADNQAAVSNPITVVVQAGASTTALTANANPAVLGQSLALTATLSSISPNFTGQVTFLDGTTSLGTAAVSTAGVASLATSSLIAGPHTITAVYAGDTNHAPSTSAGLAELIVENVNVTLASSANPAIAGTAVVFSVRVVGEPGVIPTGAVTFKDGATGVGGGALDATGAATFSTSTLAVGTHAISVNYAGDLHYAPGSTTLTQTIQSATTQIVLTASANPAIYGSSLGLTATIASTGGTATGSVTFTDGGTAIGTGVVDSTGVARLALATLAPGPHAIVANYTGDSRANDSVSTPLTVSVLEVTSAALTTSVNPASTLAPIVLTVAVTNSGVGQPTGLVAFTDGGVKLGSVPLDATGQATLSVPSLSAGNHSIIATYAGDGDNFPTASPALTEGVTLRATSTTLSATQTNPSNPLEVTLIGVVRWTGPTPPTGKIAFTTSSGGTIGSSAIDATGVASLTIVLASASESIVASYSGDTAYAASVSLAATISGGPATQFTMALTPSTMSFPSKQHGTVQLTIQSVQNFSDTLQFGCLGLPQAATCTFSSTSMALTANGGGTVQLIIDTGDPLGAGAQAALARPGMRSSADRTALLCFLPGGLLAGIALFRLRRRSNWRKGLGLLIVLLAAVVGTLGVSGCSGLQVNGTPAGTYQFKVTAAGQGTGVTQSQVMTLTVTQ